MQALDLTTKFFKPLMKHLHIHPTIIRYSIHTVLGRCDFPFHDEWKFLPVNIFKGSIAVPEALEAANTVIFPQPAPSQSYFIGTIGTPPPPTPPPPFGASTLHLPPSVRKPDSSRFHICKTRNCFSDITFSKVS